MKRTKDEIIEMTNKKRSSKKTVDRLVMDELLEMGFSYSQMGTHYLYDTIVYSTKIRLEDFKSVNDFCQKAGAMVCKKYGVDIHRYSENIRFSIESAFNFGNMEYLLEIFKCSCNKDRMCVGKNTFIMTVRKKIIESLEKQESYNANQLRIIIQGELENIIDIPILESMYNIVISLKGGVKA